MPVKKIVAIIDELQLESVEKKLGAHGVMEFSIHPIKGRGHYCNTFSKNGLVSHIQIEIFTNEKHASKIAKLIIDTAHVGADNEGLVAIISVDELFGVSQKKSISGEEYQYFDDIAS